MTQGPFLLRLCQRGAFTGLFGWLSFFVVPFVPERKAVSDRLPHEWHKPSPTAGKPGRIGIRPPKQVSTNGYPYFPWGGLPAFTLPAVYSFITVFLFVWGGSFGVCFLLTDFPFRISFSICLYFRLPPFLRLSVSRIRWSFSFWVQR